MGLATSDVSMLTEDLTKRSKVASLYVRENKSPAIHVSMLFMKTRNIKVITK
ncbi:hypothetical protein WIW90_02370 [Sulfolobaceae archaeon RB850M]|jgi:hypothetical protein